MRPFEEAWRATGRSYGPEELEGVKLGWDMALEELSERVAEAEAAQSTAEHLLMSAEKEAEAARTRAAEAEADSATLLQERDHYIAQVEAREAECKRWIERMQELERRIDRAQAALKRGGA